MFQISPQQLEALRRRYPADTRVRLERMKDPYSKLTPGKSLGTVICVDDIGTIHVNWDEGSSLGVCFKEDACSVVNGLRIAEPTGSIKYSNHAQVEYERKAKEKLDALTCIDGFVYVQKLVQKWIDAHCGDSLEGIDAIASLDLLIESSQDELTAWAQRVILNATKEGRKE